MLNLLTFLFALLTINFGHIVVTILVIMIIIAVLIGIFYLFERFVTQIGQPLKGILIFIVIALLIIYAISNGGVIF